MPFSRWNRSVVGDRRILFEQLEERIVLDASVDSGFHAADSLVNSQQLCSSCASQSNVNATIDASALSQQVGTDAFFGRRTDSSEDGIGLLHLADVDDHRRVVKIVSTLPESHTIYMKFIASDQCQKWGENPLYTPADFPGWTPQPGTCNMLYNQLQPGENNALILNFDKPDAKSTTITLSLDTTTGCHFTQGEITVHNPFSGKWHDGWDISVVNGFDHPVKIEAPYNDKVDIYTPEPHPLICKHTIQATSELGNSQNFGVFGLGWTDCQRSINPPCAVAPGEAHPDNIKCQSDGWHEDAVPAYDQTFTVTFGPS